MAVRVVRLGTPRAPGEGLRLGTVRRPPRGVKKEDFPRRDYYDLWLPALSPSCPPRLPPPAAPLSIVGVWEGDLVRRPSGSTEPLHLTLSALGGSGRRWWFLDGAPLLSTAPDERFEQALRRSGRHQLSVLDEGGETARLEFSVSD